MRVAIVSRHPATIEFLKKIFEDKGFEIDVIEHVDDPRELDEYSVVAGNIPLSMMLKTTCQIFMLLSLNIPREFRGKELGYEEAKKYAEFIIIEKFGYVGNKLSEDKEWCKATSDIVYTNSIDVALYILTKKLENLS